MARVERQRGLRAHRRRRKRFGRERRELGFGTGGGQLGLNACKKSSCHNASTPAVRHTSPSARPSAHFTRYVRACCMSHVLWRTSSVAAFTHTHILHRRSHLPPYTRLAFSAARRRRGSLLRYMCWCACVSAFADKTYHERLERHPERASLYFAACTRFALPSFLPLHMSFLNSISPFCRQGMHEAHRGRRRRLLEKDETKRRPIHQRSKRHYYAGSSA